MICPECRQAAADALYVLALGNNVGMGALGSAMAGHEKCRGGTWCDCGHQTPEEAGT